MTQLGLIRFVLAVFCLSVVPASANNGESERTWDVFGESERAWDVFAEFCGTATTDPTAALSKAQHDRDPTTSASVTPDGWRIAGIGDIWQKFSDLQNVSSAHVFWGAERYAAGTTACCTLQIVGGNERPFDEFIDIADRRYGDLIGQNATRLGGEMVGDDEDETVHVAYVTSGFPPTNIIRIMHNNIQLAVTLARLVPLEE